MLYTHAIELTFKRYAISPTTRLFIKLKIKLNSFCQEQDGFYFIPKERIYEKMSVKTYSLKKDGDRKLSDHFKVREFRCKDGTDKILIESGLIAYLEKVYDHFDCSKINISSGYRTASHDKKVGGKGSGNHVQGKAVDFIAYGKSGKAISSKEVALYLEDIGVKGIGYRIGNRLGSRSLHSGSSRNTQLIDKRSRLAGSGRKSDGVRGR